MIAFAADLHLTNRVWKARRDLDGDSFKALRSMEYEILKITEITEVVLAGDVFDAYRIDKATLQAFTDFVNNLSVKGITVYVIQGNHDKDSAGALAEVQGAHTLNERVVELSGYKVSGLNWRPREDLKQDLLVAPECDVMVLHCMFDHLVTFDAAADLSLDDIPPQVKNVVVGDVHIRDITELRGSGVCVSPWSSTSL